MYVKSLSERKCQILSCMFIWYQRNPGCWDLNCKTFVLVVPILRSSFCMTQHRRSALAEDHVQSSQYRILYWSLKRQHSQSLLSGSYHSCRASEKTKTNTYFHMSLILSFSSHGSVSWTGNIGPECDFRELFSGRFLQTVLQNSKIVFSIQFS